MSPRRPTRNNTQQLSLVSIQPTTAVLGVLPHLKYTTWYALAEFVDNAMQSYLTNRSALQAAHGRKFHLTVNIARDQEAKSISIRDNAAGIAEADFERALQVAAPPPDRSGLAEFGMGMKSAACWFSDDWTVETSALGEDVERHVNVDVQAITAERPTSLEVISSSVDPELHYTHIILRNVRQMPRGRNTGKIREHLASIYRRYLEDGRLRLTVFDEALHWDHVPILVAPNFDDDNGPAVEWRKELDFEVGRMKVKGFAAIRERGSTSKAGFAIFRRDRLIVGSEDDGWRPVELFGRSNSYRYQRVFGELDITNLRVTHTKDGIQWSGTQEEDLIEALREELSDSQLPILKQAEGYRARTPAVEVRSRTQTIVRAIGSELEDKFEDVFAAIEHSQPREVQESSTELVSVQMGSGNFSEFTFVRGNNTWEVIVAVIDGQPQGPWLSVGTGELHSQGNSTTRTVKVAMSTSHPFVQRFMDPDGNNLEAVCRIAASVGLAEVMAKFFGYTDADIVREYLEELLRIAFSSQSSTPGEL